jgi:hypothetical protein
VSRVLQGQPPFTGATPESPCVITTAGWRKFLSFQFWEYKTAPQINLLAAPSENGKNKLIILSLIFNTFIFYLNLLQISAKYTVF